MLLLHHVQYLKVLVPHEIQGLFNLLDGARTFSAEISSWTSFQILCILLKQKVI